MAALLEVRGLCAAYGTTRILHGLDFAIDRGQVTALLGANGAGKTTTLRALGQYMVHTTGEITFAGRRIDGLATEAIARRGIGHVPEGRGTFLSLTTEENLRMGSRVRQTRARAKADIEAIYEYFPRLKERRNQQAGTLSGGEQQMLAIGRALVNRPKLLLLDEPSFGLAPLVVRDIFSIMRRIAREQEVSLLLVEQNARLALNLADKAYLLETGRIVLGGSSEEIKKNDAVRRAYLGV